MSNYLLVICKGHINHVVRRGDRSDMAVLRNKLTQRGFNFRVVERRDWAFILVDEDNVADDGKFCIGDALWDVVWRNRHG